ncbi:hypothetical protein [Lentzea nigeriaca]|uniref:hypothetical protein n=1 Tax=Lentzea nigeriaca TaxID=1128665 RepID=UPI00195E8060|nr:hypothetical protein [Lentzea nigeriaca]MBM7862273.1 hypothetical protein [Lentzea nigeriaca]
MAQRKGETRIRSGCARRPDVSVQVITAALLTLGAIDAKNRESLETSIPGGRTLDLPSDEDGHRRVPAQLTVTR